MLVLARKKKGFKVELTEEEEESVWLTENGRWIEVSEDYEEKKQD